MMNKTCVGMWCEEVTKVALCMKVEPNSVGGGYKIDNEWDCWHSCAHANLKSAKRWYKWQVIYYDKLVLCYACPPTSLHLTVIFCPFQNPHKTRTRNPLFLFQCQTRFFNFCSFPSLERIPLYFVLNCYCH